MLDQLPLTELDSGHTTGQVFNVRRIICIGRNYAAHAREMGHDPRKEPPFFFFKPVTSLATGGVFTLPNYSQNVHHELELVAALNSGGRDLNAEQTKQCLQGFALGLDMTCRDIQQAAKTQGRPWELAKGFDGAAPCTPIAQCGFEALTQLGTMTLKRNGNIVQQGHWRDMVWSLPELLAEISHHIRLIPGDLIMTGTPEGVGPVTVGDRLQATMEGFPHSLSLEIQA